MGNMTNTFFDNLDAAATWSAGVAFKRSKGLPLDKYSVFETKALAIEYAEKRGAYAETPVSYPGQVIAVAEDNKMVAYVLAEKADGSNLELQQIGIIPTGDGKTIDVTEDGVISLLAADTEVFKKDADGNPTEEKEINAGAQLVLQSDGTLKWVKPDTTTVEGLSTAVEDLKGRMTTAEGDIDALEEKVGKAATDEDEATGLFKAIDDIDVILNNEEDGLAVNLGRAMNAIGNIIDTIGDEDTEGTILYTNKLQDEAIKRLEDNEAGYLTSDDINGVVVFEETYATDKKALEDAIALKADKSAYDQTVIDLDNLEAKVDAFLTGTGATEALDSLQELIAYIDSHDDVDIAGILEDIEAIENKLAGIDTTVVAYVTAAIDAIKIGDYAKAADLTALAGRVTTLEAKVDVEGKVSEAIAAAEGRAATDAQDKADKALADAKTDTDTKLADYYKKTEVNDLIKDFATDDEVETAIAAEAAIARAAEKANADAITIKADQTALNTAVSTLEGKINLKADQTALDATNAAVATKAEQSALNTAVSTLEDAIEAADTKAQTGINNAATAQSAAEVAQATANSNATNIEQHNKELYGEKDGEQVIKVGLVEKVGTNTSDIADIKGTLTSHDGRITANATAAANAQSKADSAYTLAGTKADAEETTAALATKVTQTQFADAINDVNTSIGEINTELAKKAVAETVNADLAKKADKETTYSKEDVNGLIAPLATTEALNGVKATAEQGVADAAAAKDVADAAKARIDGFLDGTAEAESAIDTLVEIQQYMNSDTEAFTALSEKVTKIENGTTTVPKATEADTLDGKHATDFDAAGAAASALTDAKAYADAIDTGVMSVTPLHEAIIVTPGENGAITINFADEIILNGGGADIPVSE